MLPHKQSTFSWENTVSMLLLVKKLFNFIVGYCTCKKKWTRMQERERKGIFKWCTKILGQYQTKHFLLKKKKTTKPNQPPNPKGTSAG